MPNSYFFMKIDSQFSVPRCSTILNMHVQTALRFFLQSTDASLLSKGHHWSVSMKLNQAVVIQGKVMPMMAAEERGTAAVGGALHVFTSNSPFMFQLTD